ncbi:MAG: hypothetical protein QF789_09730 [Gammaproteobacteria bacterium]|jgi:hypothetical protein|nr:hypothetical protein [Chromatiales bacterium]MDP7297312.1 hypothetical protein [Gammaproteobacteria bacterium]MDP7661482.1 hypothetical protein [Gammaproteobacteria bacterium]HJP04005.1 hypothetical protein [Gammaproteobacteria bacterium]
MKDLLRELYFGFIAILMLSELVAGNLYSLLFAIERPAELMAVSIEVAYRHMSTLAVLDAIVGVGAGMVIWSIRYKEMVRFGRNGVFMTTLGMLVYGGYQFWHATYQLGATQPIIKVVGTTYAALGVGAWFVAGEIKWAKPLEPAAATDKSFG